MAQFDFFSQPRGPEIDINLYPRAASAGIQAGNSQKTIAESIMGGVEQGLDLYGKYQRTQENDLNLQIKENQVEQLPVQNRIEQAQAQNAESIAQINDLKAELDVKTQTLQIDAVKSKLEADKAKADEETSLVNRKSEFETQFKSLDPANQKAMIFNGQYNDVFAKYPDVYKRALGSTVTYMTPEEKDNAASSLDFIRKMEIDTQRQAVNAKFNQTLLGNFEKTAAHIASGPMRDLIKGKQLPEFLSTTQMYPTGVKQYDPKTGELNDDATDGKPIQGQFDVFVNGKFSPYSSLVKEKDYQEFNSLQDSYSRLFGKIEPSEASKNVPGAPNAAPPAPKKGVEALTGALKKIGFDTNAEASLMKDVAPSIEDVKTQAKNASIVERAIAAVEPYYLNKASKSLTAGIGAADSSAPLKSIIETNTKRLASESLEKFKNGTSEEKGVIRDWAKANGVTPTYSGFRDFYEKKLTTALDNSFKDAWEEGLNEKAKETRQANAVTKIKADAENAYKDKSLAEALGVRKSTEALTQPEPTISPPVEPKKEITPEDVTAKIGVSGKEARAHAAVVNRVNFSPLFADKPFYVKAVGADESSGGKRNLSKTGVVGPMQVTKPIAAHYRKNRNIPEENMEAGQMLLEDLFNNYNGNRELAYAAYNSGEPAVNYARRLANSNNWKEVKHFMLEGLKRYEEEIGVPAHDKLKEVYNYPERIGLYEKLFV